MKATLMGAGSLLVNDRSACVGRPLINLTPKISEDGKDADARTSMFGEVDGDSSSSSTISYDLAISAGFCKVSYGIMYSKAANGLQPEQSQCRELEKNHFKWLTKFRSACLETV